MRHSAAHGECCRLLHIFDAQGARAADTYTAAKRFLDFNRQPPYQFEKCSKCGGRAVCSGYICQQRWRGAAIAPSVAAMRRITTAHSLRAAFSTRDAARTGCGRLKRVALNGRSLSAYLVCFLQQHHAVRRGWPLRHRQRVVWDPVHPAAERQARCGGILCSR